MFFRLLSFGVLTVGFVMLTDTRSQADCDDDDDGCCVRVCRPCRPPTCCAPAPTRAYCICPYYEMGGIWYAERFEWIEGEGTDCTDGNPVGVQATESNYCSPTQCGCGMGYSLTSAPVDCEDLYLADCIDPDLAEPPGYTNPTYPHATTLVPGGPHHLAITSINGVPVSRPIYVAYYKMRTNSRPRVHFWIGWECETPNPLPGRRVDAVPAYATGCNAFVRVLRGGTGGGQNDNDILIRLTKNGCSP
jgi:hypothetical protein